MFIFKIEYLRFCVIYNIYMYVPSHPLMAVHLGNDSNSSIKVKWTWLCQITSICRTAGERFDEESFQVTQKEWSVK